MAQKQGSPRGSKKSAAVVAKSQSSKKGFYLLLAAVAVVGIAALSYVSTHNGAPPPIVLDPSAPPVNSAGYVLGSPDAKVELTEFGDFECPACEKFSELTEADFRAKYVTTGKVRFRFIDFPLVNVHRNTLNASVAAACADEQGKFWQLHDMLYVRQPDWNGEATDNPDKAIKSFARTIPGLDAKKFDDCLDTRKTLPKVQAHMKLAEARQVAQTPTFAIGNVQFVFEDRPSPLEQLSVRIDSALAAAQPAAVGKPAAVSKPRSKPRKP
jgi:protein-disulfide isomerase